MCATTGRWRFRVDANYSYLQYSRRRSTERLLEPDDPRELRFPDRLSEEQPQRHGGHHLLADPQPDRFGKRNDASNIGYDSRAVLGSNISENIDFTVSWNGTYNEAKNSLLSTARQEPLFQPFGQPGAEMDLPAGLHPHRRAPPTRSMSALRTDYNDESCSATHLSARRCSATSAARSDRCQRHLQPEPSFVRTVGSGWTQNATNSVVGRYYMVQFTYNLRHFGRGINDNNGGEGAAHPERGGGERCGGSPLRAPSRGGGEGVGRAPPARRGPTGGGGAGRGGAAPGGAPGQG